jgi:hypothetical protein
MQTGEALFAKLSTGGERRVKKERPDMANLVWPLQFTLGIPGLISA